MTVEELKQLDRLTMSITPEGDGFVARCVELGVVGQGKTELEAESEMLHAADLYLMSICDDDATTDNLCGKLLPDGIQFSSPGGCWTIDTPHNIPLFIRSLDQLLLPGSIICLEGTGDAPDVLKYLHARQASKFTPVRRDTFYPAPRIFHLPMTAPNLEGLANLFATHPSVDICWHIKAYLGEEVLLYCHDAFDEWPGVLISNSVPEACVKKFSEATGLSYRYAPYEIESE